MVSRINLLEDPQISAADDVGAVEESDVRLSGEQVLEGAPRIRGGKKTIAPRSPAAAPLERLH